jgi:uncharacterized membrane protein
MEKAAPDFKIEKSYFDKQLEIIALVGLVILWALPAYYFGKLPDSIPIHFNASGQADAFAAKAFIWLLPLAGLMLHVVMTLATKDTKNINYPGKITEENRERVYTNMIRMTRVLKVTVTATFIWIVWGTIKTALGMADGLPTYLLPLILLIILGPVAYYSLKAAGKIG